MCRNHKQHKEAAGNKQTVCDHAVSRWLTWLGPRAQSITWRADGINHQEALAIHFTIKKIRRVSWARLCQGVRMPVLTFVFQSAGGEKA